MVWFNVDDTLAFHPKAIEAGNAALGLWVRAGSWSAQTLSDGFVPRQIARSLGTVGQCKALVVAGLWLEVDGGYQFHEWDQRQRTKEDVQAQREMERKRKSEQRKRSRVPGGQLPDIQQDNQRDSIEDTHRESQAESAPESTQASGSPLHTSPLPSFRGGAAGGSSYESNTRENSPRPPKHHEGHPSAWVEDCGNCTALVDRQIAWFASAEPPVVHCPAHPGGTPDACGGCGEARRVRKDFDAAQARAKTAHQSAKLHRAAEDRARTIADCDLCDHDGYAGTRVCDHDPDTLDRARRGSAVARAALAAKHKPIESAATDQESAAAPTEETNHVPA